MLLPLPRSPKRRHPQPETLSDKTLTVVLQTEPTALASGYETIDELHYRFTLRDDVCYSDGTPVKARMSSTASPSTLSPASPMPVTLTWKA